MGRRSTIPEAKIEKALRLFESEPTWGWVAIGEVVDINPSTLGHIFKRRWGLRARGPRERKKGEKRIGAKEEQEIADFYLTVGKRNKYDTARVFGISAWRVSNALINAGYPDEAYPSQLAKRPNSHPPIESSPVIDISDTLIDALIRRLNRYEELKVENETLKQHLREKEANSKGYLEKIVELQNILARPD